MLTVRGMLLLLAVLPTAISHAASPAEKPISPEELTDEQILQCVFMPPKNLRGGATEEGPFLGLFESVPEAIAAVRESFQQEHSTWWKSYLLPLPYKLSGIESPALAVLGVRTGIGSGSANLCLMGRVQGQVKLVSVPSPSLEFTSVRVDPKAIHWVDSEAQTKKYLIVSRVTNSPSGPDEYEVVTAYRFDLSTRTVSRLINLGDPERHESADEEPDQFDWRASTRSFHTDRKGRFYMLLIQRVADPNDAESFLEKFHYFRFDEGKFTEVQFADLDIGLDLRFGAIASPNILPKNLLMRLQTTSASIDLKAEDELAMADADRDDAGCELGKLGLQKFKIFLGSPAVSKFDTTLIRERSIRIFRQHGIHPRALAPIPNDGQILHTSDGMGTPWILLPCEYRVLLPQVDESRPAYCESSQAPGFYLTGQPLAVEVPACHVLKRLARLMKQHPKAKYLAIPISGEMSSGDRFNAIARIQLVDGDWDERFTGPATPPGKK